MILNNLELSIKLINVLVLIMFSWLSAVYVWDEFQKPKYWREVPGMLFAGFMGAVSGLTALAVIFMNQIGV